MAVRNGKDRWGSVAMALHWLMAVGLIGNLVLGDWATDLSLSPTKLKAMLWHKSIGISLLMLVILRIGWRLMNKTPDPVAMPVWQTWLARLTHGLFYLLMLALPLSGWVLNSAAAFPLKFFSWFSLPAIAPASDGLKSQATNVHYWLGWLLIVTVALHLLGVLKHVLLDRDRLLSRMLPGGSSK